MEKKIVPERLKLARERAGFSMAEASRRLNLSKIGYCRYEYGERTPSIQTVEVIARCLNTSVEYLTGQTDDMSPDYLVISKEQSPELYSMIEFCKQDKKAAEQILELYRKLHGSG